MTTTMTLTRLRDLRLGGMAQALERQQEQVGTYDGLAFTERLGLLLEHECLEREHRKQERLIRQARFKLRATVQDIDYQHSRNIKQAQIARLAQGEWIDRGQNLLITGPCGSGKTYLACLRDRPLGLFERLQRALLSFVSVNARDDSSQGRSHLPETTEAVGQHAIFAH